MRLDLDDLPPRIARLLADLKAGDELLLVQGAGVVSRLAIAVAEAPPPATPDDEDIDAEAHVEEVLGHFKMMIEDEF
jgi:hypothetical protein